MLIAMAGLPGTGKSTIAHQLAYRLTCRLAVDSAVSSAGGEKAIVLDKDRIRAALFPPSEIEYSTRQDDLCMRIMFQVAEYILRKDVGRYVILDGRTFSRRYQVDAVRRFARELGIPCAFIECVCSDRTVKQRLERDAVEGRHPAANRDYEMYLSVKARFEPIERPKLVVDTDETLERCVRRCLEYVTLREQDSVDDNL